MCYNCTNFEINESYVEWGYYGDHRQVPATFSCRKSMFWKEELGDLSPKKLGELLETAMDCEEYIRDNV